MRMRLTADLESWYKDEKGRLYRTDPPRVPKGSVVESGREREVTQSTGGKRCMVEFKHDGRWFLAHKEEWKNAARSAQKK